MDFEKILKELKESLIRLLNEKYKGFKNESKKDIEDFLESSKEKLEKWSKLLLNGDITPGEFEWLLKSQKDLLALKMLQKAGLSKISLGHMKNNIIELIVNVVKGFL
ncbi:hypothetical protein [Abyssalbus ytuae]|uniref:Uncharacterized protein n=1 Tax=Abyssalbus ytuae TaxID=2926907 RepID=A0A9E6ZLY7_9FLAO|nr:hypothetical protein [Abyssalbus ytuae]UOB17089.1 hypothetical protein MQE35_15280 [Abyssalbus ytuae]